VGLTLIAILTAALLLPGIIAARAFYFAAQTKEVEVAIPSLSSPEGIALVGAFSVGVHFLYIVLLKLTAYLPQIVPLPLADPYILFAATPFAEPDAAAYALFSGLVGLSLVAFGVGFALGRVIMCREDKSLFYGPLSEIIERAHGDDRFITAYVITKIGDEKRLVGYQGTIVSLFRDADRYPTRVVLKDVVPFYLKIDDDGPKREETDQLIDWLVLSAGDWHNIAFRVFRFEDRDEVSERMDPPL